MVSSQAYGNMDTNTVLSCLVLFQSDWCLGKASFSEGIAQYPQMPTCPMCADKESKTSKDFSSSAPASKRHEEVESISWTSDSEVSHFTLCEVPSSGKFFHPRLL